MKNQRGFVGIGVLIAIILGLVVLGGGAYFVMQQNTTSQTASDNLSNDTVPAKNTVSNTQPSPSATSPAPKQTVTTPTPKPAITAITIFSPNGGETYKAGDTITLRWEAPSTLQGVEIALGTEGCGKGESGSCASTPSFYKSYGAPNTGEYKLKIPVNAPSSDRYKIIVADTIGMGSNYSTQSKLFSITASVTAVQPKITVSSPSNGATLTGNTIPIKWKIENPQNFELMSPDNVSIQILASTCSWDNQYGSGCLSFGGMVSVPAVNGEYQLKILSEESGLQKAIPGTTYYVKIFVSAEFKDLGNYKGESQFSIYFVQ